MWILAAANIALIVLCHIWSIASEDDLIFLLSNIYETDYLLYITWSHTYEIYEFHCKYDPECSTQYRIIQK